MSVLNVQSLHRLLRQRKDSCPTPAQGSHQPGQLEVMKRSFKPS